MLSIGKTLMLEQKYSTEKEPLKCMVVEIGDGSFNIDFPVNVKTGKIAFLVDGTQLKASFTDDEQGTYLFDTEVFKKVKSNIPMLQLMLPPKESFIKIQRRQFVRIETMVDVAIHPKESGAVPFRTITEDLSAGGAAIRIPNNKKIEPDSTIDVWFALSLNSGEIAYLQMHCKAIRIVEGANGFNSLSVQFVKPSKNDTQVIMRYIFEKQVEMKKRGLLE